MPKTAVRPVVQPLQIQEVHTWPHSNVLFSSCSQPVFSTGRISALLHFHDSKQRLRDRATLLLSSCSCCTLYNLETSMSSVVAVKQHLFFTLCTYKTPCGKSGTKCLLYSNVHDSGVILLSLDSISWKEIFLCTRSHAT